MNSIPEHLQGGKCGYCSHSFEQDPCSEWCENHEQHYKSMSCPSCGKKNWGKVEFDGSGHDEDFSPLESAVRKVKEG